MVRAKKTESNIEMAMTITIAALISARWLRTVRVKVRSFFVAKRILPSIGTAAEMIGVRSGALRTSVTNRLRWSALTASGHACRRSTGGSA